MDSPISLQYPNGRVHEQTMPTTRELMSGDQFDLYGRHWNVVGLVRLPRGAREERRMLCVSTSSGSRGAKLLP